jgi:hypothetical protein
MVTSHRPNRIALQKNRPSKGADLPPRGGIPDGPVKAVAWPDPGQKGNSSARLRGIAKVKTRMMENI